MNKRRWILAVCLVLILALLDFWLRRGSDGGAVRVLAGDSEPVVGAVVELYAAGTWRTLGTTGMDGRLAMPVSGELRLRVRAEGYGTRRHRVVVPEDGDLELRLQPAQR